MRTFSASAHAASASGWFVRIADIGVYCSEWQLRAHCESAKTPLHALAARNMLPAHWAASAFGDSQIILCLIPDQKQGGDLEQAGFDG
jgi:hypothetical protein